MKASHAPRHQHDVHAEAASPAALYTADWHVSYSGNSPHLLGSIHIDPHSVVHAHDLHDIDHQDMHNHPVHLHDGHDADHGDGHDHAEHHPLHVDEVPAIHHTDSTHGHTPVEHHHPQHESHEHHLEHAEHHAAHHDGHPVAARKVTHTAKGKAHHHVTADGHHSSNGRHLHTI